MCFRMTFAHIFAKIKKEKKGMHFCLFAEKILLFFRILSSIYVFRNKIPLGDRHFMTEFWGNRAGWENN